MSLFNESILLKSSDLPFSQPLNPLPPGHNDSSMDIPKRRPNTLGKGFKDKSRKSFENALMQALEDSGHSEASGEVPVEKSVISANISSTQFNLTTNRYCNDLGSIFDFNSIPLTTI